MKHDGRLSATLHALLHMADHGAPMTSEELARHMGTNPVVVRRTMAGLREAGFVRSARGPGGGWEISADLALVTLRDVYTALGAPRLLAVGLNLEHSACLVEQAVNRSLTGAFAEAEAVLIARMGGVTLADLAKDFSDHAVAHRAAHGKGHGHA